MLSDCLASRPLIELQKVRTLKNHGIAGDVLAEELGLAARDLSSSRIARIFSGQAEVILGFTLRYKALWLSGVRAKLCLQAAPAADDEDRSLVRDWLNLLERHSIDFTLGWRRLVDAAEGNPQLLENLFPSLDVPRSWLERWHRCLARQSISATVGSMRAVNPVYIPRNHLVEEALAAASDQADLTLFKRPLDLIMHPYEERSGLQHYAEPAPRDFTARYKTFCGT